MLAREEAQAAIRKERNMATTVGFGMSFREMVAKEGIGDAFSSLIKVTTNLVTDPLGAGVYIREV